MVPIPLVHRDPRHPEAPDAFRPGRSLNGPHLPFGAGARACIAQPLARRELAAILPAVFRARRLRPLSPDTEPMVLRATILDPQRSGLVI